MKSRRLRKEHAKSILDSRSRIHKAAQDCDGGQSPAHDLGFQSWLCHWHQGPYGRTSYESEQWQAAINSRWLFNPMTCEAAFLKTLRPGCIGDPSAIVIKAADRSLVEPGVVAK